MKKRKMLALVLCLCSMGLLHAQVAGGSSSNDEMDKKEFRPYWFMQVQGGIGATHGELGLGDMLSPAAALYGGYRFTPVIGLRAGLSGWQAKGSWVSPEMTYKYNYMQFNVDAMFDLSTLLCSYNRDRVFNLYGFAGVGLNYGFNNDDAAVLFDGGLPLGYFWRDNRFSPVGRVGLGFDVRLTDRVAFNVEGNANVLSDHFNSKNAGNPDWQYNVMAGFTFRFGKSGKKVKPVEPVPAPAPAPAPVEKKEEPVVKPAPAPAPKEEVKPLTENVFFRIDSSVVRDSELSKIDNLVAYLNKYPKAKITLTGYADVDTGTKNYNLRLSEKRAQAVAKLLKEKGVAESRIVILYKGDTVQPFGTAAENRVTIGVAAE